MVIVCNPAKIADEEKSNDSPMILYFDSLGSGSLSQKSKKIRDYLGQRYKQETGKDIAFDGKSIRGKSPKLPTQPNGYDCGVYLLHYVEMFINKQDKDEFYEKTSFKDWFDYSDIKLKRKKIIRLLESLTNLDLSYLLTENKFSNEVEFMDKSKEKEEKVETIEDTPTLRRKNKSVLDTSSDEEGKDSKEEVKKDEISKTKKDEIIVNTFDEDDEVLKEEKKEGTPKEKKKDEIIVNTFDDDDFKILVDENSKDGDSNSVENKDTELDMFFDDIFSVASNKEEIRVNQSFEK
jgi:hypothetical protein